MIRRFFLLGILLGTGLAGMGAARAQDSLEAAKQAGMVGERPDGLVGFVTNTVPVPLRSLVEQVNSQRVARYRDVARNNGVALDKVQAVAGSQLVERTPSGHFIMNANGIWVRKP